MISNEILNEDNMLEVEFEALFPSYGTMNYNELENKPSVNGVTLEGDKTTQDLKIEIPDVSEFITNETDGLVNYYDRTTTDEKLQGKANTSDIPDVSSFITVDVNNLTNYELKADVGNSIALSIDPSTFVMTLNLKNSAGEILSTGTVDLPLETMVVNASYDNTTKEIILSLQNGNVVRFSVADLVSGLAKSNEVYTREEIDNKGYLTNETDPTVPAHVKNITQENITSWNNKSDFSGSYNDLTDKPDDYVLPIASASVLGGVKVGENLSIDGNGVLSAVGGSSIIMLTLENTSENIANYDKVISSWKSNGEITSAEIIANTFAFKLDTIREFTDYYELTFTLISGMDNVSMNFLNVYYYKDGRTNKFTDNGGMFGYGIPIALNYSDSVPKATVKVLSTDNTKSFVPTSPYHPATKQYVDNAISVAIGTALGGEY